MAIRLGWPRVRRELRDLVELVLLPGLAAFLPWRACFRLYAALTRRWHWLYRETCERALAQAQARGWVDDPAAWIARRRLVTLIDHADFFLSRTRSRRFLDRHMSVSGTWPTADAAVILCTFHWGAGMWGLRHIAASGLRGQSIVAAVEGGHFAGRRVMHRYIVARTAEVARVLGIATLDVRRSMRPVVRALQNRQAVIAAIDVPADQVGASQSIPFLGSRALVPRALLRLAVEQRIPVCTFLTGIDLASGQRLLRIEMVGVADSLEELAPKVFAPLERAIRESPADWHFWSEAGRFFERDADGQDLPPRS